MYGNVYLYVHTHIIPKRQVVYREFERAPLINICIHMIGVTSAGEGRRGSAFIEGRVQAVRLKLRPRPAVRLTLAL